MVTKSNLAVAVLCTFCLTSILFMITTTRSQTGEYQPWTDINDDGTIDIYDLIKIGTSFGTAGDPTKNVSVTNFPLDEEGNIKVKEQTTTHTYTDAVEITVLDSSTRLINGTEYGVPAIIHGGYFAFSPKQNFISVTKFSFMVMGTNDNNVGYGEYWFDASIDNQLVYTDTLTMLDKYPDYRWGLITDPVKCSLISPGMHFIKIVFADSVYIYLQKIVVVIEYEYQA